MGLGGCAGWGRAILEPSFKRQVVWIHLGEGWRRRSGSLTNRAKRGWGAVWLAAVVGFAALHAVHLDADFPNHSPWLADWAKYTDEGWYGNAAMRAHLFGNWYMAGDFNPAVAMPVWSRHGIPAIAVSGCLRTSRSSAEAR